MFRLRYWMWSAGQVWFLVMAFTRIKNKCVVLKNLSVLLAGRANLLINFKYGVRFWVRDVYDILAVYEMWEKHPYDFLFDQLKKPTTFVDVGGYNGDSSVYASKIGGVRNVIVVEPAPGNYEILKRNLEANGVKKTIAIQGAVAGERGRKRIYLYPNRRQVGPANLNYNTGSITVESLTLAELVKKAKTQLLVLKCDAEGAEYEIFKNVPIKTLKKFERILIEYHFGYFVDEMKLDELVGRLVKAGFGCLIHKNRWLPGLGYVTARKT